MHEAGHAAHFANIEQPSPLFAQERAPTSVAYAELQSMFLDSLVGDAAWRGRYARDRDGKPVPWELVESDLRSNHPYKVFALRAMIAVPYFEKALYELPEAEVTAERITALADEIETKIQVSLVPMVLAETTLRVCTSARAHIMNSLHARTLTHFLDMAS
jgi:oligoendopeptidase F